MCGVKVKYGPRPFRFFNSCVEVKYGPRPFKFLNSWLKDIEVVKVVKESIEGCVVVGPRETFFANKLRACETALKKWRDIDMKGGLKLQTH